jgi:DNA-binding PadR family transcriptional regulator
MSADLTRAAFLILLSLADRNRHGLGIMDEVESRTDGAVRLGPGTLYGTLKRLAGDGLVEVAVEPPDPTDDDPRRRYYRLTAPGRSALAEEAEHLQRLVTVAQHKRVLPERV